MTKLIITGKYDAKRISQIEVATSGKRPEGMMELFIDIETTGRCESYSASRIYYLAYLLAENCPGLRFEVKEG